MSSGAIGGGLRETTYVPTADGFDDYDSEGDQYQVEHIRGKKRQPKMGTIREDEGEEAKGSDQGSDTGYDSGNGANIFNNREDGYDSQEEEEFRKRKQ